MSHDGRLTVVRLSFDCRSKLLKYITVLALLLTVGVGDAWGETSRLTLKSSTSRTSGWTNNNVTWTFTNLSFVNNNNACVGSSSGSVTITPPSGATVTKITVKKTGNSWARAAQLKLFVGSSSTAHTTLTSSSSETTNISITGANQSASSYTLSNSTNKNCWVEYIEITFTAAASTHTLGYAVLPAASGTVDLSATTVAEGGTATATATPNSGYRFSSWAISGTGASLSSTSTNPTTVTMGTANATVTANFVSKGCTDHGASSITGGALSDANHGPLHAYYDYSTSQILYTKSDLDLAAGKKGTIKSIYFEYSGATAMAARTIKIYMANTDLSSLTTSNYVPYASFTQVYSGTFSCGSAGWYEITLDTPFDYNGAGQLAVMIDDNTNTFESSKSFKYHSATGKQIYKRQDDTDIDPASWTPASAIDYRPNTKFCIQEADMTPATVTLMDNGATITEVSAGAGVTLPSRAGCTGYTFAGWTKTWVAPQSSWTTTAPTIIPAGSYTPAADENLYPVYTKTEGGGGFSSYTKVTSAPDDWSGKYLISDGTLTATGSKFSSTALEVTTLTPGTTEYTSYEFTITKNGNNSNYFIITPDGTNYVGYSGSSAGLAFTTSTPVSNNYLWTCSTSNPMTLNVGTNTRYIGVGTESATSVFKAYSTSGTNAKCYLYKRIEGSSTTSYISVPGCCTDWSTPTVSYSSSLAINSSEGVTIGSGTTHGAVTYESSDEDVLTVDADGTIHAVGAGTAHITATWAGDATYCEKSANSNDVTVCGIQVTGTTPVNFGQVYQNAVIADKTIYVTGLGLANAIIPSLPAGSPFSFSPASLAANSSNATLTISASTATIGDYNQTLTLTSGAFSATVTIKMEVIAKPTATFTDALHNLTEDEDGVSLSSYNLTAAQGTPVVFPTLANQTKSAGTCEGEYYIFVGWTEGDNNTDPEDNLVTSYTLANGDTKNYYAVWADASGSATYTKLTTNTFKTAPTKYVIGAEHEGTTYYFSYYDPTEIANDLDWGTCSSSDAPIQFTLSGTAAELVVKDNLNNYLEAPCTTKAFYISDTETTVELKLDGTIYNNGDDCTNWRLRYNNAGPGLRWYTSDTEDAVYFYEVGAGGTVHYRTSCCANKVDAPVVTSTAVTSTSITLTWPSDVKATGWQIEWNGAGGWVTPSGSCTHTVSGLTPNTTYTWRVRATYEDPVCGADVRSGSTTTNQVYHVTYAKGSGTGTCTATGSTTDATGYEAGATVTLQDNGFSLAGHTFAGWTEDDEDITISSNQFTMPDHDVVITASWTAKMDKYFDRMHDQTDALHGGVEETEGANEGKYYIPKEGCNYSVPTAVDSNTGDACQTSHYKLQGWIAASYMKGYPDHMTGEIGTGNEVHIFPPTGTKTATGATYYAIWAEVTE